MLVVEEMLSVELRQLYIIMTDSIRITYFILYQISKKDHNMSIVQFE